MVVISPSFRVMGTFTKLTSFHFFSISSRSRWIFCSYLALSVISSMVSVLTRV